MRPGEVVFIRNDATWPMSRSGSLSTEQPGSSSLVRAAAGTSAAVSSTLDRTSWMRNWLAAMSWQPTDYRPSRDAQRRRVPGVDAPDLEGRCATACRQVVPITRLATTLFGRSITSSRDPPCESLRSLRR
jgi:endonuclease YncB( thermonuclease family)